MSDRQKKLELISSFHLSYISPQDRLFLFGAVELEHVCWSGDLCGLEGIQLATLSMFCELNKGVLDPETLELIDRYIAACKLQDSL